MNKQKVITVSLLSFFIATLCAPPANASEVAVGRYTSISSQPTRAQLNPLLAIAKFKFPVKVQTVGQAITMVLQLTGYTLVEPSELSAEVRQTLKKPLPIPVRELGPIAIKDALLVLMGNAVFDMTMDPVNRLINFNIKPKIAKALRSHQHG